MDSGCQAQATGGFVMSKKIFALILLSISFALGGLQFNKVLWLGSAGAGIWAIGLIWWKVKMGKSL